jgi:hypothetical protein
MKPPKSRTVPAKLIDSIDKEEARIASICGVPEIGDTVLVAAAKTANRQAFEVLVARHQRRILGLALRWQEIPAPAKPSVPAVPQEAHRGPKTVLRKRKWVPSRHHPWREAFSRAEPERQRELAPHKAPPRLARPFALP